MPVTVVMPRLSDSMQEGTIIKWLKNEGEPVEKGDPLAEIETDKANMQLDSYESGILDKIIVGEGGKVPVGEPIALVRGTGEAGETARATTEVAEGRAAGDIAIAARGEVEPKAVEPHEEIPEHLKASPVARRIAQEAGIDIAKVKGTGPGGRITREDVESFVEQQQKAPAAGEVGPQPAPPIPQVQPPAKAVTEAPVEGQLHALTKMQETIARRMTQSKTTVPHFYVTIDVDAAPAMRLRKEINDTLGKDNVVSVNDLVIKAVALAVRRFPYVNASYQDGSVVFHDHVNIGIAVTLPEGLLVPVLHDVDKKGLPEIARESRELIERTRNGRLQAGDLEGGTFTVSNLGMYDVEEFAAIINPPESAILAVGSIKKKPVVQDDKVVISDRMRLTLSVDHRSFYGATAAEFLQTIKQILEQPLNLIL